LKKAIIEAEKLTSW